jgi:hypothetical protein
MRGRNDDNRSLISSTPKCIRWACPERASDIPLIAHADNIDADWRSAFSCVVKSTDARKKMCPW